MEEQINWIPGMAAAFVGLVAGIAASLWLRVREQPQPDLDMQREDLDERKSHLVAQLRELEQQRVRMDPNAYDKQRTRYEEQAVAVLRARADLGDETPIEPVIGDATSRTAATSPLVAYLRARPQLRGALWTGVVLGVAALLFFLVTTEQQVRSADGSLTGNNTPARPMGTTDASTAPSGMIPPMLQGALDGNVPMDELVRDMQAHPDDVKTLVAVAHELVRRERFETAAALTDRTLMLEPHHAEALIHKAVLEAASGDLDGAMARLDAVLKTHPELLEGWIYRALVALQRGDRDAAADSLASYVRRAPDGAKKSQVQALLTSLAPPAGG
ncbi:MAG: tetratricopeptide repeat protein [Myxococcota bacterium]